MARMHACMHGSCSCDRRRRHGTPSDGWPKHASKQRAHAVRAYMGRSCLQGCQLASTERQGPQAVIAGGGRRAPTGPSAHTCRLRPPEDEFWRPLMELRAPRMCAKAPCKHGGRDRGRPRGRRGAGFGKRERCAALAQAPGCVPWRQSSCPLHHGRCHPECANLSVMDRSAKLSSGQARPGPEPPTRAARGEDAMQCV